MQYDIAQNFLSTAPDAILFMITASATFIALTIVALNTPKKCKTRG